MAAEEADLEGFIEAQVQRRCWACNLPEDVREQVDTARRRSEKLSHKDPRRATVDKMVAWLRLNGFTEATRGKFNNHFAEGHHLETP